MRIAARVGKLERRHRFIAAAHLAQRTARCEVCGSGGEGAEGRKTVWRVVFDSPDTPHPDLGPEHDHCTGCGRRLVYRMEFDRSG